MSKPDPWWCDAFSPDESRPIPRAVAARTLASARREGRVIRDPAMLRAYYVFGNFGERHHLDCWPI
jgi:hypothetical protein